MKFKIIGVIVLLLMVNLLQAQSNWPFVIQEYGLKNQLWQDSMTKNQILKWKNGNVKVEYIDLYDSLKIRRDYFENGMLKMEATVYQVFKSVNITTYDEFDDESIRDTSGYLDVLHGKYKEYQEEWSVKCGPTIITSGQFTHGFATGNWERRGSANSLIVANFSKNGFLKGEFFEYYFDRENPKSKIKWKGQFDVFNLEVDQNVAIKDYIDMDYSKSHHRVGIWKHYNEEGVLIETVTYDWNLD